MLLSALATLRLNRVEKARFISTLVKQRELNTKKSILQQAAHVHYKLGSLVFSFHCEFVLITVQKETNSPQEKKVRVGYHLQSAKIL